MAAKKSKAPTFAEVSAWVTNTVNIWTNRQSRFEEEQDMLELRAPIVAGTRTGPEDTLGDNPWEGLAKPNTETFISANARILIEKVARSLGSARAAIEYTGQHPDAPDKHQVIENMLRWMRKEWSQRWQMGLHAPLQYEAAYAAASRGWIVSRLLLNSDDSDDLPVLRTLHDAATVYPYEVDGRVVRVVHQYRASVSDLMGNSKLDGESWLSTLDDKDQIEVSSVYAERDGAVWHAVIGVPGLAHDKTADEQWLKKPVKIGYMPWVITLCQGANYRETPWGTAGSFTEWMGTSAITTLVRNYRQRDKLATMLFTVLSNSANPAKSIYSQDPALAIDQIKDGFKAGDTVALYQGDKVEFHRIGPNPGDFDMMYNILRDVEHMGSLPPALWGDPSGITSGQQLAIANNSAKDFLFPFVDGLVAHEQACLRRALEIIRDYWPKQMDVFVPEAANRPANMVEFNPSDLHDEGVNGVQFVLEDTTPQDFAAMAQVWSMLVREHLASMKRARGRDGLKFDDPELEDMEVMGDLVKSDEQMVKFMMPFAMLMTGQKLAGGLYEMLHGPDLEAQVRAVMEQAMNNAMGGGAPSAPAGPAMPNAPMLGGEVLPPGMQTGFTPGQFDSGMQPMNPGLVMGGMGGGGMPPPGGEPAFGDQLMLPLGGV